MKSIIFVQARMSSKRFPGKVMKEINGKKLIDIIFDVLKKTKKIKKIVVLTSTNKSDDILCNHLKKQKINFFRGSLENVYQRFFDAVDYYKVDQFVRITGDSPFINPKIINECIVENKGNEYDIVTNVFPRSFPIGQSVELINSKMFKKHKNKITKKKRFREHITSFFYENSSNFKIKNIYNKKNLSTLDLSINYKNDIKKLFKKN